MGRDLEGDIKDPVKVSQGNRESLKKTWDTARAMTRVVLGGEGEIFSTTLWPMQLALVDSCYNRWPGVRALGSKESMELWELASVSHVWVTLWGRFLTWCPLCGTRRIATCVCTRACRCMLTPVAILHPFYLV